MKSKDDGSEDKRPFFINESGVKVHIRPIEVDASELIESGLKDEYRAKGKPIDPPEIEITTAGGTKVKQPLTDQKLTVEGDEQETAKRQAEWLAYVEAKAEFDAEFGRLSMELLLDGIDEPIPPDEEWIPRFKYLHMPVPDDPIAREFWYKRRTFVKTPGDMAKLQSEVLLLSSSGTLDRKKVEAKVEAFFRQARLQGQDLDAEGAEGETPEESVEA